MKRIFFKKEDEEAAQPGKKYLQIKHLTKDLQPEYVQNSHNSKIRKHTTWLF